MYISQPSSPVPDRLLSIVAIFALHLAVGAALVLLVHPAVSEWMAEPLHIQLVSDAAQKAPEPAPEPPKVRPMESRARPVSQPPAPQTVPLLQTQAEAPANAPVMEAPPVPRDTPVPVTAQPAQQVTGATQLATAAAVTPPIFDADYLDNPRPAFPRASISLREEGRVLLRVQVGEDGRPLQVLIDTSSGFQRLDRAARDTVASAWKFEPARQGNKPVVGWVRVPIIFELR